VCCVNTAAVILHDRALTLARAASAWTYLVPDSRSSCVSKLALQGINSFCTIPGRQDLRRCSARSTGCRRFCRHSRRLL
jgi:hypothetical protein